MESTPLTKVSRIAIAVVFCNKPDQTIECLESVKNSSIYIFNNGSDKEALKKVAKYCNKHNIEIFHSDINKGASYARNHLAQHIKEDWILFLDNDITVKQKEWEKIATEYIVKNPEYNVFVPTLVEKGFAISHTRFGVVNYLVSTIGTTSKETNKFGGGAVILNKRVFVEHGYYDEDFFVGFEDHEYCLRAIKSSNPIRGLFIPEIELIHEHRKSTKQYDNDYLGVRYDTERLKTNVKRIKSKLGFTLSDDGVNWSLRQVESMISQNIQDTKGNVNVSHVEPIRVTLYAENQVKIGGIETFNRNFCKRMSKYYDITFLCKSGDPESLLEISKWAKVEFYTGQSIETDVFIYGVAWGNMPQSEVKAKLQIQMIHGDYEWLKNTINFTYKKMPDVTHHIAVGKNVQEKFKKVTGFDSTVIYNLLDPDVHPRRLLRLISVTRFDTKKGIERMEKLARELRKFHIPFLWLVFGDSGKNLAYGATVSAMFKDLHEVVFMGSHKDTINYTADSDYLVALSDSEGFSYSINEALQVGTPCITTDFPSAYEQIEEGVNGYMIDMQLTKLNGDFIDKIYNKIPKNFKFEEKVSEQDWINVLGGDGQLLPPRAIESLSLIKVRAIRSYTDLQLNKSVRVGEVFDVPVSRALELRSRGFVS